MHQQRFRPSYRRSRALHLCVNDHFQRSAASSEVVDIAMLGKTHDPAGDHRNRRPVRGTAYANLRRRAWISIIDMLIHLQHLADQRRSGLSIARTVAAGNRTPAAPAESLYRGGIGAPVSCSPAQNRRVAGFPGTEATSTVTFWRALHKSRRPRPGGRGGAQCAGRCPAVRRRDHLTNRVRRVGRPDEHRKQSRSVRAGLSAG